MDFAATQVVIRSRAIRVRGREHGVVARWVPWARHGARHTTGFEDQVAWFATERSKTAVVELMRVGWGTVGAICERVLADGIAARPDRLDGLQRIGVDEISYRKGQRYVTVVVDHDTGRLVWCYPGRDAATLDRVNHRYTGIFLYGAKQIRTADLLGAMETRAAACIRQEPPGRRLIAAFQASAGTSISRRLGSISSRLDADWTRPRRRRGHRERPASEYLVRLEDEHRRWAESTGDTAAEPPLRCHSNTRTTKLPGDSRDD